jgi:DNA polymerase III alpha subunit
MNNIIKNCLIEDEIISCEYFGEEETYDLEIDSKEHDFIANDVVVSNSHADAYTVTSFREFWLKAHYGLEFYTSLLNCTGRSKEDKYGTSTIAKYISYIQTCPIYREKKGEQNKFERIKKVEVLPVDVNKSGIEFEIENDNIRFGLIFVKGITKDAAEEIIKNRPFKDIDDFVKSENKILKNKRIILALIKSGALDSISQNKTRSELYNYFISTRKYKEDPVCWDTKEIIENEIEYTNISFTEIDFFTKLIRKIKNQFGESVIAPLENAIDMENGNNINSIFRINKVEKRKTKTGKLYYIFSISDGISMINRVYYWRHKEEKPIEIDEKKIYNNIYAGCIIRQNNFYNVKNLKYIKSITGENNVSS